MDGGIKMKKLFFALLITALFNCFNATNAVADANTESCDLEKSDHYCPSAVDKWLNEISEDINTSGKKLRARSSQEEAGADFLLAVITVAKFGEKTPRENFNIIRPPDKDIADEQASKAIKLLKEGVAKEKITKETLQDMVENTRPYLPKMTDWLVAEFNLAKQEGS